MVLDSSQWSAPSLRACQSSFPGAGVLHDADDDELGRDGRGDAYLAGQDSVFDGLCRIGLFIASYEEAILRLPPCEHALVVELAEKCRRPLADQSPCILGILLEGHPGHPGLDAAPQHEE